MFKRYICTLCNYMYEENKGSQHLQLQPGQSFEQLPDSWQCPDCAASKEMFVGCSCESYSTYLATCVPAATAEPAALCTCER